MNTRKNVLILLMILPLIGFIFAFILFPFQIPMHFDLLGAVDRIEEIGRAHV